MSTCIGCQCDDNNACYDEVAGEACHWLAVNHGYGIGVCSLCPDAMADWDGALLEAAQAQDSLLYDVEQAVAADDMDSLDALLTEDPFAVLEVLGEGEN